VLTARRAAETERSAVVWVSAQDETAAAAGENLRPSDLVNIKRLIFSISPSAVVKSYQMPAADSRRSTKTSQWRIAVEPAGYSGRR
jgi:hypothetical protein